jgi:UDP-N-acetylmuramoyl-L-alanyl-D-glutamate--2,6-diaminopimelate ligase
MKYIKNGIKNTKCVKGRLEKYKKRCIYIDYAHTPEAMECVIKEIRKIYPKKRLIVVFGCGGERDKEIRPKMGKIATEMADITIITSDNSRNEGQKEIFADILKGVSKDSNYQLIEDREMAIKCGVEAMKRNGVLLLLGKGHEIYQIDKTGKNPFDERVILDKIFKE